MNDKLPRMRNPENSEDQHVTRKQILAILNRTNPAALTEQDNLEIEEIEQGLYAQQKPSQALLAAWLKKAEKLPRTDTIH